MALVTDGNHFFQDHCDTQRDHCIGGLQWVERLGLTLSTIGQEEIHSQGAEWRSVDGKSLRGNFRGKGDSG